MEQKRVETDAAVQNQEMSGLAMSVEEAFAQLEQKISVLEDEQISLKEAFLVYQEGMELLKYCNDSIDEVEKKVLAISQEGELYEFQE